jgi:hypothetical protein
MRARLTSIRRFQGEVQAARDDGGQQETRCRRGEGGQGGAEGKGAQEGAQESVTRKCYRTSTARTWLKNGGEKRACVRVPASYALHPLEPFSRG